MDNTFPVVVEVNGITHNLTHDSLVELIKEHSAQKDVIAANRQEASDLWRKVANIRNEVYDFFKEAYDSEDPWVVENKDDINFLLERIGSDILKTTYSATVTVTFTVDDIEAGDEDEVTNIIQEGIYVSVDSYNTDVTDICVDEVTEQ